MYQYFKYSVETMKGGDWALFLHIANYFLFNKLPKEDMIIENSEMGKFACRSNSSDFMCSFFSYENHVKELIRKSQKEFNFYMDIGACIGDYSIWLAKLGMQCYAFEPSPENYSCLQENIELNNVRHLVTALNYGLANKSNEQVFHSNPRDKSFKRHFFKVGGASEESIQLKTLDQVIFEQSIDIDKSFIINLHVEGMERDIIEGAKCFFKSAKKILLIYKTRTDEKGVLNILRDICDFKPIEIDTLNQGALITNN